MPKYTYICETKGCFNDWEQERIVPIEKRNSQKCYNCKKVLKKLISKANLKGVG